MLYYLIAGEASGDLHAAQLIAALRALDPDAQFRGIGGDAMQREGMTLLRHYRTLAYMGWWQVLRHLPTILRGLREVKADLRAVRPDRVILVDYPGFNLRIARWLHREQLCPLAYYILPKTWATRPSRNCQLAAHTHLRLSILPFEHEYFARHGISTHYVGNPTRHEVSHFLQHYAEPFDRFAHRHGIDSSRPLIALLPGSRTAEIEANLPRMLRALRLADPDGRYGVAVAQAPHQPAALYHYIYTRARVAPLPLVTGESFALLHHAHAALVTSGTATLETALLGTPQVVCYHLRGGRLINRLKPYVLRCPYISLVNLIAQREVVPELIAADTHPTIIAQHLLPLLTSDSTPSPQRAAQLQGIHTLRQLLGRQEAPIEAAKRILKMER